MGVIVKRPQGRLQTKVIGWRLSSIPARLGPVIESTREFRLQTGSDCIGIEPASDGIEVPMKFLKEIERPSFHAAGRVIQWLLYMFPSGRYDRVVSSRGDASTVQFTCVRTVCQTATDVGVQLATASPTRNPVVSGLLPCTANAAQ